MKLPAHFIYVDKAFGTRDYSIIIVLKLEPSKAIKNPKKLQVDMKILEVIQFDTNNKSSKDFEIEIKEKYNELKLKYNANEFIRKIQTR